MIIYIERQFCCTFFDFEDMQTVRDIYKQYSVQFKEGYRKLCVIEQKISLDEFKVNELFEIWPNLVISWGGIGGKGCEMSLSIFGTKEQND